MRKLIAAAVLSLATLTVAPVPVFAEETPATTQPVTSVPVKSVVLFSSGVGYFEHRGVVHADTAAELHFKTEQINDILKSLVLKDLDGGKISVVSYPSQDPVEKTLKSFQVDLTSNPSLADLLNQLRGAKVSVQTTDSITGTILGVEKQQRPVGDKTTIEKSVLNLVTDNGIRAIEMDDVRSFHFEDASLQRELTRALAVVASGRDKDKKPITLHFAGSGDRHVRVGYVVETPVWKVSYRLILGEKDGKTTGGIQGYAIVDNQTDSDWSDISLSLISGRPISFIEDLYSPLYVNRPVVGPDVYASVTPQQYQAGFAASLAPGAMGQVALNKSLAYRRLALSAESRQSGLDRSAADQQVNGNAPAQLADTLNYYAGANVASVPAEKVGELFQYNVGNVNVPRQTSAMIPIIGDSLQAEKVSIYNASVLPRNPLNGVWMKNTTGKNLMAGPVTVLDDDVYAGDARIDSTVPDQHRLLSYGVDQQMTVDSNHNTNEQTIIAGKIVKGVMQLQKRTIATQDYVADNKSDKDKTIIIEHPIKQGWHLVDTDKPMETTDSLYRFKGTVPSKKSAKMTVKEEIKEFESIGLLPLNWDALIVYVNNGQIDKSLRDALAKAANMKQVMADTERQVKEHKDRINDYTTEQNRIRENLRSVNQNSQYYQRLITKLNDQETAIEKLQLETDDLQKQLDKERGEYEGYLNGLSVG
jgi:hypothetical protein